MGLKSFVYKVAWAADVYPIWLRRNFEESIIQAIEWDVKSRAGCWMKFEDSAEQNPVQSVGVSVAQF